ncbi:hypothetical protein [Acetobacter senegalensis]|uniref:hypothetical protein n=1 Tax=Acetobacter senegalensis TaxID=446692 RepID=UPI001EDEF041|nr:hypothetical protein [Acetobacter senegalensis]
MGDASQFHAVIKSGDFPCPGAFAARVIRAQKKFGGAPVIMGTKPSVAIAERIGAGADTVFSANGKTGKGSKPRICVAIWDSADCCQHFVEISAIGRDVVQSPKGLKMKGLILEEAGNAIVSSVITNRDVGFFCLSSQGFL